MCEIPIRFVDPNESTIIRDRSLIAKIPLIVRSIEMTVIPDSRGFKQLFFQYPDWKTTDFVINDPILIPFAKKPTEFLLNHVRKYEAPEEKSDKLLVNNSEYSEAKEQEIDFLLDVMSVATYLECDAFHEAIGFVVAKKLNGLSVEEIGEVLNHKVIPKGSDEENWMKIKGDS
uniref:Skp1 domain-containing protein n=1 Tax=Caenorhabditis tropicalis TaxID=1561998 RepID=A0A1I7TFR5_9PELO